MARSLVIVVGGTFARNETWYVDDTEPSFASALKKSLQARLGSSHHFDQVRRFVWSGDNTHEARVSAAFNLANLLNKHVPDTPEELHVHFVSHSHGGNVILYALSYLWNINQVNSHGPVRAIFDRHTKEHRIVFSGAAKGKGMIKVKSMTFLATPFFVLGNGRYFYTIHKRLLRAMDSQNDHDRHLCPVDRHVKILNLYYGCGDEVIWALYFATSALSTVTSFFSKNTVVAETSLTEADAPLIHPSLSGLQLFREPYRFQKSGEQQGQRTLVLRVKVLIHKLIVFMSSLVKAVLGRVVDRYTICRAFGIPLDVALLKRVRVCAEYHVEQLEENIRNEPLENEPEMLRGSVTVQWDYDGLLKSQKEFDPKGAFGEFKVELLHGQIHEKESVISTISQHIASAML
jgi:hypothetical protein